MRPTTQVELPTHNHIRGSPRRDLAHLRAVLRLRPRLSYHEDEYFEIDAHDGPIE